MTGNAEQQAKRIVITGASGVGKTSLAAVLAKRLALPLIPETARVICRERGWLNPTEIPDQQAFRLEVLARQIEAENRERGFVSDRGTIDCWALWQRWQICSAMTFDSESYYRRCRDQARTYTHVIFIPPLFSAADDEFRWTDSDYIAQMDRLLRLTLVDWELEDRTFRISCEDPERRAEAVIRWLGPQHHQGM